MNKLSIICAAGIICLSTAAVDGVKAKGTFRLQGPWPSLSVDNKIIEKGLDRCRGEQIHHVPNRKHPHQVCFVELLNL
jgi:hypothetical protein